MCEHTYRKKMCVTLLRHLLYCPWPGTTSTLFPRHILSCHGRLFCVENEKQRFVFSMTDLVLNSFAGTLLVKLQLAGSSVEILAFRLQRGSKSGWDVWQAWRLILGHLVPCSLCHGNKTAMELSDYSSIIVFFSSLEFWKSACGFIISSNVMTQSDYFWTRRYKWA